MANIKKTVLASFLIVNSFFAISSAQVADKSDKAEILTPTAQIFAEHISNVVGNHSGKFFNGGKADLDFKIDSNNEFTGNIRCNGETINVSFDKNIVFYPPNQIFIGDAGKEQIFGFTGGDKYNIALIREHLDYRYNFEKSRVATNEEILKLPLITSFNNFVNKIIGLHYGRVKTDNNVLYANMECSYTKNKILQASIKNDEAEPARVYYLDSFKFALQEGRMTIKGEMQKDAATMKLEIEDKMPGDQIEIIITDKGIKVKETWKKGIVYNFVI
ncbi:MAG: hypothetical protein NTW04_03405 [Elusimicrobia bacterium]|nr:hypothetical protein [Elusimicrobiota bacterium]